MSWTEERPCRLCGLPCPPDPKVTILIGTLAYHRVCWEAPGPKVKVDFPAEPEAPKGESK